MEELNSNIPIYRAKKIDSDEYVEGIGVDGNFLIIKTFLLRDYSVYEGCGVPVKGDNQYRYECEYVHIDTTTLAIHFPDMLAKDSDRLLPNGEKDLRIFASINKNGKGGDICTYTFGKYSYSGFIHYEGKASFAIKDGAFRNDFCLMRDIKIIGIQQ